MSETSDVTKSGEPVPTVTDVVNPKQKAKPAMSVAVNYRPIELNPVELHAVETIALQNVDQRIRAFLSGETDGEDVLPEIYDHVLDEPVPERLLAVLRR